jgi:hypothetical protein
MKYSERLCVRFVYIFEIETARLQAAVCKELCALRRPRVETKGKRRGAYSAPLSLPLDLDVHEHHRARRHSPLSSSYG